jgi:hypothetical protein
MRTETLHLLPLCQGIPTLPEKAELNWVSVKDPFKSNEGNLKTGELLAQISRPYWTCGYSRFETE